VPPAGAGSSNPTGFGRWREHDIVLNFFPHYHRHQQPISQLTAALAGYDALTRVAPELPTNGLIWMASREREVELHRTVPPRGYLVATAAPNDGNGANPAGAIWLPLGSTGLRKRLADLPQPHRLASERP
jgi:hypothetical protein